MAPLRYAAKFDPFLSLDCAPTPSTLAQSKERKGSNVAIWQPWPQADLERGHPERGPRGVGGVDAWGRAERAGGGGGCAEAEGADGAGPGGAAEGGRQVGGDRQGQG